MNKVDSEQFNCPYCGHGYNISDEAQTFIKREHVLNNYKLDCKTCAKPFLIRFEPSGILEDGRMMLKVQVTGFVQPKT